MHISDVSVHGEVQQSYLLGVQKQGLLPNPWVSKIDAFPQALPGNHPEPTMQSQFCATLPRDGLQPKAHAVRPKAHGVRPKAHAVRPKTHGVRPKAHDVHPVKQDMRKSRSVAKGTSDDDVLHASLTTKNYKKKFCRLIDVERIAHEGILRER